MNNGHPQDQGRRPDAATFSNGGRLTLCWNGAAAADETRECKPLEMRRLGLALCALSAVITVASAALITIWL